ncbi:hypothetical protein BHE74_00021525 [Ensete ventricosum]|nr:hypothetical protein BHE74_00021525 [Ensete ventricosum]
MIYWYRAHSPSLISLSLYQGSPYRSIPAYRDLAGMVRAVRVLVKIRQLTGMQTARYWVVPPKSIVGDQLKEKSTIGGRLREKSIVDGRLREKKGRRRRGYIPPFPSVVLARVSSLSAGRSYVVLGDVTSSVFSRARRWNVSQRGEKYRGNVADTYLLSPRRPCPRDVAAHALSFARGSPVRHPRRRCQFCLLPREETERLLVQEERSRRHRHNNNNPLDHLRSQWRVALLCRTCLARVKSADICSYCFSPIADAERSLTCLSCSCRVHVGCVDREHRCLDPCRLEPGSFTCVDCCVIPKFWGRKPGIGSRVSLEVVVREASSVAEKKIQAAARAREIALKKADATNRAAERARNALGAVLAPKVEIPEQNVDLAVVTDQELALQLHLAMNGSRRISRSSSCSLSSGAVGSIDTKKVCDRGGDQMSRTVDSGDQGICKAAEICAEDNSFVDVAVRTVFGQGSDVDSESNRRLIDDTGKDGPTVMPLEDQGNSSDKIVSSDADFCSTDSVSLDYEKKKVSDGVLFPSTCRRYVIEGSEVQENNSITTPDRYLVKYTARRSRPKGLVNVDYPLLP